MAKGTKVALKSASVKACTKTDSAAKAKDLQRTRGETHAATNARLRARIVALMVESPDMTVADMALELKVSAQRIRAYLTKPLRDEVEALRSHHQNDPTLEDIDRAMRRQARLGNVQAARLVYLRMAQQDGAAPFPTLEELEAELVSLKKMERAKGDMKDDTGVDGAVTVVDDAC